MIKPIYIIITLQDRTRRDRYSKGLITTLQSTPTTTYFWLRTGDAMVDWTGLDWIGSRWDVDSSGYIFVVLTPCIAHSLLVMHSIPKDEMGEERKGRE